MATGAGDDLGLDESGTPWLRVATQARARRTVTRVLDAGATLLAERGYEGFSIGEVCRRAKVSPGALYERVDGKDSLFLAIHDRELRRMTEAAEASFSDSEWDLLPTAGLVARTVHRIVEHYDGDRDLLRAFILRAAVDDRVSAEGARWARRTEEAIVARLMSRAQDYPHPDPRAAVVTVCRIVTAAASWRIAFGADFASTEPDDPQRWLRSLDQMVQAFLLGDAQPATSSR
jgi:AcrR family transcriptional regulator